MFGYCCRVVVLGSEEIRFECLSTDVVLASPKCCKERVGLRTLARRVWEGVSDR